VKFESVSKSLPSCSPEVHVGHGVLADGNVSADGLGSPVVMGVDGFVVGLNFAVEDTLDGVVVTLGLGVSVSVVSGDLSPSSVHMDEV